MLYFGNVQKINRIYEHKCTEVERNELEMRYCISKQLCVCTGICQLFFASFHYRWAKNRLNVSHCCIYEKTKSKYAHTMSVAKVLQHLIHAGCGGGVRTALLSNTVQCILIRVCTVTHQGGKMFMHTHLRHVSHKHTARPKNVIQHSFTFSLFI